MSTFEDDDFDFGEDDTELELSGLEDDDEPLSLEDDGDFTEED